MDAIIQGKRVPVKAVIVGDSFTFLMSGDKRAESFVHFLNRFDITIYPEYWLSYLYNIDDDVIYCWRMTTGARKLTSEILDDMFNQGFLINSAINSEIPVVFTFGAMEFYNYIPHTKDPKTAASTYFNTIHTYCFIKGIKFRFASPIYSSDYSYFIKDFNDELDRLCAMFNIDKVIRYDDTGISYSSYVGVDKYNHAPFSLMQDAKNHILNSIKE